MHATILSYYIWPCTGLDSNVLYSECSVVPSVMGSGGFRIGGARGKTKKGGPPMTSP